MKQTCIRDIKLETETETVGPEPETETRHKVRDISKRVKCTLTQFPKQFFSQLLKSNTKDKSLKSADHLNCINYKEIKYFSHSEIFMILMFKPTNFHILAT